MNSPDRNTTERKAVARYAWQVTAVIVVLFVIAPFTYTFTQQASSSDQFDPTVNMIEMIGIGGCMSAIAFCVLAIKLRASGKSAARRTPSSMRQSLNQGLILTLLYWMFFIALTRTGGDSDGILRGWMVILFPVLLLSYVLLASRQRHTHAPSE